MIISTNTISSFLLFVIFFLTFFGFYAVLLLFFSLGIYETTELISIPLRITIGLFLIFLIRLNIKRRIFTREVIPFLIFSLLYYLRIIYDEISLADYYLSTWELFFYFTSFSVIPFMALSSLHVTDKILSAIIKALFFSGFIFSFFSFWFYSEFIGEVERLKSSTAGEQVLSPLILSYCSVMIIGVTAFYLLFNKTSKKMKLTGIISMVLSAIPFFLGASRGSLVALFIPFLLLIFISGGFKHKIKLFLLLVAAIFGIVYLDNAFGSGLLKRFLGLSEDIASGSSSTVRLEIWETSFQQFLSSPFFGDKLKTNSFPIHPHNLFIEVLQTLGVLGFLPFLLLIISSFKISFKILKQHRNHSWIVVIFIQAFFQHMFSSSIYAGAWFWTSIALLISLNRYLKTSKTTVPNTSRTSSI